MGHNSKLLLSLGTYFHLSWRHAKPSLRFVYTAVTFLRSSVNDEVTKTLDEPNLHSDNTGNEASTEKLWRRLRKSDPAITELLKNSVTQNKIRQLAEVMECDEMQATELLRRNSPLIASGEIVFTKIKLVMSYGFSASDIIANPSVLHRTVRVLKDRLERLEEVTSFDSVTLHSLKEPDRVFEAFLARRREESRIQEGFSSRNDVLANLLDCDVETVKELVKENNFLQSTSLVLVKNKVAILLKYNFFHQQIRNNIRVLQHTSVLELDRRLGLLQKNSFLSQDPDFGLIYLLTCSLRDFSKSFEYLMEKQDALEGFSNKKKYLCSRLNCSEQIAERLLSSRPFDRMSEIKLRKVLDFFLKEVCVNPDFVVQHKRLMMFSVERLRSRWNILCTIGENDITLLPNKLSISEDRFDKRYASCRT